MSTIPYDEAAASIRKEIGDYVNKSGGVKLPEVKIEKSGARISLQFGISDGADLYLVVKSIVMAIGPMQVHEYMGQLSLENGSTGISISPGLETPPKYRFFTLLKLGDLTSEETRAVVQAYMMGNPVKEGTPPIQRLLELGVTIYGSNNRLSWDYIAGYEDVKREIRDNVILPFQHPEIYEKIARGTRRIYEPIRPKAVLFEGPPGTGKTTIARIIAGESNIQMVYVPIESIMTKWYGESERNLASVFDACRDLGNSLIFLDEIDSLATSREKGLYEATRRVLSVLLRKIDGFEPDERTIVIGATNRKQDLDPALLSRFDLSIHFHLPNLEERIGIFGNYAKHLSQADLERLAQESEKMSGRSIKDVCEHSERRLASRLLRSDELVGLLNGTELTDLLGSRDLADLPTVEEYLSSLEARRQSEI